MMPRRYFEIKGNQERLENIITEWLGVKYHHGGKNKFGIDCTNFIAVILLEMKILRRMEKPFYYAPDWYLHSKKDICLDSIQENIDKFLSGWLVAERFQYVSQDELKYGDMVCISVNKLGLINHVAIYLGNNKIAHCINNIGVVTSQFSYVYARHTKYYYRLFCEGE